jgi:hypothetical protein
VHEAMLYSMLCGDEVAKKKIVSDRFYTAESQERGVRKEEKGKCGCRLRISDLIEERGKVSRITWRATDKAGTDFGRTPLQIYSKECTQEQK